MLRNPTDEGCMISLDAMRIAALTLTSFAWAAALAALVLGRRRRRPVSRLIIGGVLATMTISLLIQIADMAGWPRGTHLVLDGIAVLVGLGALACLLIGAARQSGPRAPGQAAGDLSPPQRDA